jgi:hypothetical protein
MEWDGIGIMDLLPRGLGVICGLVFCSCDVCVMFQLCCFRNILHVLVCNRI